MSGLSRAGAQGPLDIRIKWPNDVYASGKKIAGILTHSTYRSKVFRITVGCGINLANSEPSTCIDDLLRQQVSDAQPIKKEVGLEPCCCQLDCEYTKCSTADLKHDASCLPEPGIS